jgi:hypothetical protein
VSVWGGNRGRQNCDGSRADNADRLLIRPASGRQAGTRRGPTPGYSVVSRRATRRAARACAREKMPGGGALARRAATRCRRHRGPRRCLRRSSRARTRASSRPDAGSAKSQRTSRRARSRSSRRLEEAAIAPDVDTGLVNLQTRHRAISKGFQPCHRSVLGGCGGSANGLHTRLSGCDSRRRSSLCRAEASPTTSDWR